MADHGASIPFKIMLASSKLIFWALMASVREIKFTGGIIWRREVAKFASSSTSSAWIGAGIVCASAKRGSQYL